METLGLSYSVNILFIGNVLQTGTKLLAHFVDTMRVLRKPANASNPAASRPIRNSSGCAQFAVSLDVSNASPKLILGKQMELNCQRLFTIKKDTALTTSNKVCTFMLKTQKAKMYGTSAKKTLSTG